MARNYTIFLVASILGFSSGAKAADPSQLAVEAGVRLSILASMDLSMDDLVAKSEAAERAGADQIAKIAATGKPDPSLVSEQIVLSAQTKDLTARRELLKATGWPIYDDLFKTIGITAEDLPANSRAIEETIADRLDTNSMSHSNGHEKNLKIAQRVILRMRERFAELNKQK